MNVRRLSVGTALALGIGLLVIGLLTASTPIAWGRTTSANGPAVSFSSPTYTVREPQASATITTTLDASSTLTVTVGYATFDGTALAGSDYLTASGTLTFTPGLTLVTFAVPILDDALSEVSETITLTLSQPANGTLGLFRSATLTILDDEGFSIFLPLVQRGYTPAYTCPTISDNQYEAGTAFQVELDDPVRPAYNHADKNLALRSYIANTDPNLQRELVDYGSGDPTQPPQLAALFDPVRVPPFSTFYRVHNWDWAKSPEPGTRGDPIILPPVTALGIQTTPGEILRVPTSGYAIGGGMQVIVLFADEDTVALKYGREDTAGIWGYTVHVDNICTDPNLLALYDSRDDPDGRRYVYVPPEDRPYTYELPNLPAGHPIGTARDTEVVVAIVDSGAFQDPRSCNEWWQIRPGYTGTCPPAN